MISSISSISISIIISVVTIAYSLCCGCGPAADVDHDVVCNRSLHLELFSLLWVLLWVLLLLLQLWLSLLSLLWVLSFLLLSSNRSSWHRWAVMVPFAQARLAFLGPWFAVLSRPIIQGKPGFWSIWFPDGITDILQTNSSQTNILRVELPGGVPVFLEGFRPFNVILWLSRSHKGAGCYNPLKKESWIRNVLCVVYNHKLSNRNQSKASHFDPTLMARTPHTVAASSPKPAVEQKQNMYTVYVYVYIYIYITHICVYMYICCTIVIIKWISRVISKYVYEFSNWYSNWSGPCERARARPGMMKHSCFCEAVWIQLRDKKPTVTSSTRCKHQLVVSRGL